MKKNSLFFIVIIIIFAFMFTACGIDYWCYLKKNGALALIGYTIMIFVVFFIIAIYKKNNWWLLVGFLTGMSYMVITIWLTSTFAQQCV